MEEKRGKTFDQDRFVDEVTTPSPGHLDEAGNLPDKNVDHEVANKVMSIDINLLAGNLDQEHAKNAVIKLEQRYPNHSDLLQKLKDKLGF